ncbi:MAG: chemotaxis protein [Spirochaetae bacterium HGW-Spirochaetae-7]|jgi:iron only hydrogenase large subunit-like protein|nr:MAG: chemotaxis protein [Spirochaetae bacterium HGW-Spirochaetae-7]
MVQGFKSTSLVPVIGVDQEKCVNCHMCIAVCPVKFCIDGSGDKVSINADLCIGCGSCVKACTQKARMIIDDAASCFESLGRGEKMVAIVAPAIVSSFPGEYRRFLGWLKHLGVKACFDVSFGAELTIKSYLHHVTKASPKLVISQPCPAIVSYIEVYRPELLSHLAPADSPMLHTVKMLRAYYPEYADHKVLVVSPCAAKKREFDETGIGDYNVTIRSFKDVLERRKVDLSLQPESDFDNPPAERAVLFSSPGGLLRTAERDAPGIGARSRKIEGPELIYPYLDTLAASIERGINPLLVDCLNCEYGCNAGPGTLNQGKSPDEIERAVEVLAGEGKKLYGGRAVSDRKARKRLERVVGRFWKPGMYARTYVDRSRNHSLAVLADSQFKEIYADMLKETLTDHLNCASCGYKSCEGMAVAIFNGLNKKENCHLYRQRVIEREKRVVDNSAIRLHEEIGLAVGKISEIKAALDRLQVKAGSQFSAIEQSAAAVEEMIATMGNASTIASGKRSQLSKLADAAAGGERDMATTMEAIRTAATGVSGVGDMIKVVHDVADKTNLLAMNAAIQAAHAGNAGAGFAVVAAEIRALAEATGSNARRISTSLGAIIGQIKESDELTERTGGGIKVISRDVGVMADEMSALIDSFSELSAGGTQVTRGIEELRDVSVEVKEIHTTIAEEVTGILAMIQAIAEISEETQRTISTMTRME